MPEAEVGRLPAVSTPEGVDLWRLPTGKVETQLAFSVRGGAPLSPVTSAMTAFVVDHPDGLVLIDAGIGASGQVHMALQPALMRALATLDIEEALGDALARRDVAARDFWGVILTHAHWDHASGLADLPGVPVWMTAAELAHAQEDEGGEVYRSIDAVSPVNVHDLRLEDGPHGPFDASWDVFGDGAVVVVPLPGHTPGSVGILVRPSTGEPTLFIGDTAWVREGVVWPAEKPWLSRRMVDDDAAGVRSQLVFLHRLAEENPELRIVPAHDAREHAQIDVWRL